jgi:hypothetical protein
MTLRSDKGGTMNKRISGYLLVLLSLMIALAAIFVALTGLVMADNGSAAVKTLNRDLEPVVVTGAAVNALIGAPADQLFVYTYTEGIWTQIPAQVDEVTTTGTYATTEDGLLDANDEVVFMARDLGDQAVGMVPTANGQPLSALWYEIEVTDPISPTHKGWAYLVHSATLTPTFTADYVSFNSFLHRINGVTYHLGYATPRPWMDYLSLGDGMVDILDRAPKSRLCFGSLCLPESLSPDLQDDLIKDGPVRLIVRGGRVLAHGAMASWTIPVPDTGGASSIRFSADFSPAASGATYYNAAVPAGVTVDGITDTVPAEPLSSWWQLSTSDGTLIQVADTTSISGTQSNYYVDNSEWDWRDTGDHLHYGDTGVYVADPNRSFTYTFSIYFLPDSQPNLGETYAAYFMQPLLATASRKEFTVTLEAVPESLTVGQSSTLTATVDYNDSPISGAAVAFTIVSGQGTVTPTIATTDDAGQAVASLSSQVAGSVVVKAAADSVDSNTKTLTFTPGAVTTVILEAVPETLIEGQSSTLTATVVDEYSNPIKGMNVAFTIVSGQGVVTPTIATTDDAGQATASLSSQVAGSVVVKATADSVDSYSKTLTFLRGVYLPLAMKNASW